MISVALLGPVEVRRDGELIVVPAGKPTELLMRLALSAGTMVLKERLLEDLWADDAVATTANTMQSKVSRLRRALGDPTLVVGGSLGYTLAIDAHAVDALEVVRRAEEISALRHEGHPAAVVDACSAALALFRGENLFGASDAAWLHPHRTQLEGLRLRLIEDRIGARIDLGATGDVVGELEELVAAHPLREGLWALLMTALYRAGRQADALAAYRTVRAHLVEELGLEPGRELQRLEQQVLEHDPALDAPAAPPAPATPAPALASPTSRGGNLPPLSSTLVGRDDDCSALAELGEQHRLVTLVGPAGVGKTRLALEVARRSDVADGAWLVRLDTARSPAAVADTIAVALHAADASEAALVERLRGARVLIVLDNCEHVVDTVAELVAPLLRAGPDVRILATSQLPLGVDGEQVYAVEPLPFADAVALFTQRAGEHGQSYTDAEATASIDEVCRSLDGLPLAIELAAARTKALSLPEISRRLTDRFTLLRDPSSRRSERRRTLAGAISWSYDLLFPDDQRGLWALACFVGGAPLDGIEQVLSALDVPDEAAVDVVGRLVDRSLVRVERRDEGGLRYWLLDSVRSFARDRLDDSGEAPAVLRAHAEWVAGAAAAAEHGSLGPEQPGHVAFVRTERANIDAALEWTRANDPVLGLTIAVRLGWLWVVAGDALGAARLRAALAAAGDAPDELRVAGWLLLGWLDAAAGNVDLAHVAVTTAVDELADVDDRYLHARADFFLGYVLSQKGDFDESRRLLDQARQVFVELGCRWDEAADWVLTAHVTLAGGDQPAAAQACREASRVLSEVGDPWFLVHVEAMSGAMAQAEQRYGDACVHLGNAAAAARNDGFASSEAYHRANLGRAQQQHGDLDDARRSLGQAIDLARDAGDLRVAALARLRLGRVLRAEGDIDAARAAVREAQDWYRASGGGDHARLADCMVAAMAPASATEAGDVLVSVLADARLAGDPEVEVLALDALARRATEAGDLEAAAELLACADEAMPAARLRVTDDDRLDAHAARRLLS
jgi:predicted ATPase/DNA-binding SARP family transcriptional activator/predicted negative regulator of RcsB-dependent stress response